MLKGMSVSGEFFGNLVVVSGYWFLLIIVMYLWVDLIDGFVVLFLDDMIVFVILLLLCEVYI